MESTKPKNKTRNLIITVCAAVVVVVVALVVFMNVILSASSTRIRSTSKLPPIKRCVA